MKLKQKTSDEDVNVITVNKFRFGSVTAVGESWCQGRDM